MSLFFTNGLNLTQRTSVEFSADETVFVKADIISLHSYSEKEGSATLQVCTGSNLGEVLGRPQRLNHYEKVMVSATHTLRPCTTGVLNSHGQRFSEEDAARFCRVIKVNHSIEELTEMAKDKLLVRQRQS